MTTKKQIRELLKPVIANNSDIVISSAPFGLLFCLTPIRHVFCGVHFQRGRTKDYCHVMPVATETCASLALPWIGGTFERVRFNGIDGLDWDKPEVICELQRRLETEIIPQLRTLMTLTGYFDYKYGKDSNFYRLPIHALVTLPTVIANGKLDLATRIYHEVLESLDWNAFETHWAPRGTIDWYRGFKVLFEPLLNRDIPKLVTILREFERESISKSGYEKYWEKAPFPLEEQL